MPLVACACPRMHETGCDRPLPTACRHGLRALCLVKAPRFAPFQDREQSMCRHHVLKDTSSDLAMGCSNACADRMAHFVEVCCCEGSNAAIRVSG